MKYASAAAFRQALDQRLKTEASMSGLGVGRLRKRVAFELFLRRLVAVAPNRWVLKGALALDFRLDVATRPTKDIDLGRDDDEAAAIEDITAAQALVLDDFFTFSATKTGEFSDTDEFAAIRFHVTAQLAGRTFEQFIVDIGFTDSIWWTPDTIQTSDPADLRRHRAGSDSSRAPAAARRRKGPRVHAHIWLDGAAEHSAKGSRRHPADRGVGVNRSRRSAGGTRAHLRRAQTSPTPGRPPGAAPQLGRAIRSLGDRSGRGDRPCRSVRSRCRVRGPRAGRPGGGLVGRPHRHVDIDSQIR